MRIHNAFTSAIATLILCCGLSVHATNESAEKGTLIAKEVESRDEGFVVTKANLTMELKTASGATTKQQLTVLVQEVKDDGDKILFRFDSPSNVRDTTLLTYSHIDEPDQQWLYLPVTKRVKRIASSKKSGAFMGSEFAYEDLTSQETERYKYHFISQQSLDNTPVFLLERTPNYADSGYSRQLIYIDSQRYIPLQIEFFNKANVKEKTLTFSEYQQYKNKHWRAGVMTMNNHLTNKSTLFIWHNYDFNANLTDSDFSPSKLKS